MAIPSKRAMLAVALALGALPNFSAACSAENCTLCAVGECSNTEGCFDNSPGDYDPAYCTSQEEDEEGGIGFEGGGCATSIGLGVMAAVFCSAILCLGTIRIKDARYKSALLSGSEAKVTRAPAVLKSKASETRSGGGEHGGGHYTVYFFTLEFLAKHTDGSAYNVKAKIRVGDHVYNEFEIGAQLDVVFPVNQERNFELVKSLTTNDMSCMKKCAHAVACIVAVVGLILLATSIIDLDCDFPLSIPVFLVSLLCEFLCTFFALFPLCKSLGFKSREMEVTKVAAMA